MPANDANNQSPEKAIIRSAVSPDAGQKARFDAFLLRKYGRVFDIVWEKDEVNFVLRAIPVVIYFCRIL